MYSSIFSLAGPDALICKVDFGESFEEIPCELLVPGRVAGLKVDQEIIGDGILVHGAVIFGNLAGASE